MKTAEAILRIPPSHPELLFSGDEPAVHQLYHRLAAQWHPDRNTNPRATEVFQRIVTLYTAAKAQIASGRWSAARGETLLTARDGKQYRVKHFTRRPFELGELLIGNMIASYVVTADGTDLYRNALKVLRAVGFASDEMRKEIQPSLPEIQATVEGSDRCALVLKKPADMVLLADLARHLGGTVPAVHVTWILSSLYNLACWLEWAQVSHNAIGPDTVFVSPQRHAVALLGGWWYATRFGGRLSALPARTVHSIPSDIVRAKIADPRSDLELIHLTGRELLGDPSGVRLIRDPSVPHPFGDWLRHPTSGSAIADYGIWRDVIVSSFGARRFSRLEITPEEIYPSMS